LCICRANQGEFTQPRHGIPGLGIGLDMLMLKEYSYLRIYQTIDHRPQVSQDTLRKAYVTQFICHLSPGSGGHVT